MLIFVVLKDCHQLSFSAKCAVCLQVTFMDLWQQGKEKLSVIWSFEHISLYFQTRSHKLIPTQKLFSNVLLTMCYQPNSDLKCSTGVPETCLTPRVVSSSQLHVTISKTLVKVVLDCSVVGEKPANAAGNITTDGVEILGRMVRSRGRRDNSAPVSTNWWQPHCLECALNRGWLHTCSAEVFPWSCQRVESWLCQSNKMRKVCKNQGLFHIK